MRTGYTPKIEYVFQHLNYNIKIERLSSAQENLYGGKLQEFKSNSRMLIQVKQGAWATRNSVSIMANHLIAG
jgi:hypothetical protein